MGETIILLVEGGEHKLEPALERAGYQVSAYHSGAEALGWVGWFPDDADTEVGYRIAVRSWRGLVAMGSEAVPALVSALSDPDGNVRRGACWALGYIGDARAVPYLIEMLEDKSGDLLGIGSSVADAAAEALVRIGTREAMDAVEAWETDDREEPRP